MLQYQLHREIDRIIDFYFPLPDLNQLLKRLVEEKANEGLGLWALYVIFCHDMLGGNSQDILSVAAQLELIVLLQDIADDQQDQDNRGKHWMAIPQAYTWNAVLAFYTAVVAELERLKHRRLSKILKLIATSISGQHQDLNNSIQSEVDYIQMIRHKSGSIVQLAFAMGYGIVDNCFDSIIDQIDELALYIGITAQIKNDVRDVQRLDLKNDLFHKKKTLPILYMLQHGKERFQALGMFYEGKLTVEQFLVYKQECLAFIHDSGCLEYGYAVHYLYLQKVKGLFETLPIDSPAKHKLKETVMQAITL